MSKILIVAAHPDDEVLGCGGTIAKHSREHDFYCLILGEGAMARKGASFDDAQTLVKQCQTVSKMLGIKHVRIESLSDNQFDSYSLLTIIKLIEEYLNTIGPVDYIFTHFEKDLNVDHCLVSRAVQTVFRPFASTCNALLFFEVLSSTGSDFHPNLFVEIDAVIDIKIKAFFCYTNEVRKAPHPRSENKICSLAGLRGSQSDCWFAEGFIVGYMKGGFCL